MPYRAAGRHVGARISTGTEASAPGPAVSTTHTQPAASGRHGTGAGVGLHRSGGRCWPATQCPAARRPGGRLAYFVILGLAEGIWIARIPAVKARLHLTDGLLGASLLAGPGALVLVMPVAGGLADRFGSARLTRPAGLAVAVLPLALWTAHSLPAVIGALLAFGIAGGVLAVAANAQGVRVEQGYRRPLMASFHASYSLGGLAGAVLGGLLVWLRAEPGQRAGRHRPGRRGRRALAGGRLLPEPAGVRPGPARGRPGRSASGGRVAGRGGWSPSGCWRCAA